MPKKKNKSTNNQEETAVKDVPKTKEERLKEFLDNNFHNLLQQSTKEITHYVTYISFGILIGVFNMKHEFLLRYKTSVVITAMLAILGLFCDYLHNQIIMWRSLKGLKEVNAIGKKDIYNSLGCLSSSLFVINMIVLLLSSAFFSYIIYGYFFL